MNSDNVRQRLSKYFKRPGIQDIVREQTAGGIVFRKDINNKPEILLIQDAKNRWTIPKGHVEEGERTDQTAAREIQEETGLKDMEVHKWLGKVDFKYRRQNSLVLIAMHVYLVEAKGNTNKLQKEEWMNDIKWFSAATALDKIEYEDIGKLMLLGLKRIRNGTLKG